MFYPFIVDNLPLNYSLAGDFLFINLTVGGIATASTRIYVLPEAGIPISQAETLAVVQGVLPGAFNELDFVVEAPI